MTPQTRRLRLCSLPKEMRRMARLALQQGWQITVSRGTSHSSWRAPDGKITITVSGSPGDPANTVIVRRQLRRAGLVWP